MPAVRIDLAASRRRDGFPTWSLECLKETSTQWLIDAVTAQQEVRITVFSRVLQRASPAHLRSATELHRGADLPDDKFDKIRTPANGDQVRTGSKNSLMAPEEGFGAGSGPRELLARARS